MSTEHDNQKTGFAPAATAHSAHDLERTGFAEPERGAAPRQASASSHDDQATSFAQSTPVELPAGGPGQVVVGQLFDERYRVIRQFEPRASESCARALDEKTGNEVLLFILSGPELQTGHTRTAFTFAQRSGHASVLRMFELRDRSLPAYLTGEYNAGKEFETYRMGLGGNVHGSEALPLVIQLFSALDALHRSGLALGALSARNLWFEPSGQLKLAVHHAAPIGTPLAQTLSTTEVWSAYHLGFPNKPPCHDVAADLFTAALLAHHLTAGRLPYSSSPAEFRTWRLRPKCQGQTGLPALDAVLNDCLSDNFRSAAEVVAALRAAEPSSVEASSSDTSALGGEQRRVPPLAIAALAVLAVGILGAAGFALFRNQDQTNGQRAGVIAGQTNQIQSVAAVPASAPERDIPVSLNPKTVARIPSLYGAYAVAGSDDSTPVFSFGPDSFDCLVVGRAHHQYTIAETTDTRFALKFDNVSWGRLLSFEIKSKDELILRGTLPKGCYLGSGAGDTTFRRVKASQGGPPPLAERRAVRPGTSNENRELPLKDSIRLPLGSVLARGFAWDDALPGGGERAGSARLSLELQNTTSHPIDMAIAYRSCDEMMSIVCSDADPVETTHKTQCGLRDYDDIFTDGMFQPGEKVIVDCCSHLKAKPTSCKATVDAAALGGGTLQVSSGTLR